MCLYETTENIFIPLSRHKTNPRVILASLYLFTTAGFIPGKTALTLMNDFISGIKCSLFSYVDYTLI